MICITAVAVDNVQRISVTCLARDASICAVIGRCLFFFLTEIPVQESRSDDREPRLEPFVSGPSGLNSTWIEAAARHCRP